MDNSFCVRQHELAQKSIKLKVLEDLFKTNKLKIQEKKKIVKGENSELDKLHDKVWGLKNKICDEVWEFSKKHDFQTIVNNYPDDVPWNFSFDCSCHRKRIAKPVETVKDRTKTRILLFEIEALKTNLDAQNSNGLKEDMIKLKRELRKIEEENPEMQKLKREIDECKERIINLKELKGAKSNYNYEFFDNDILPEDNNLTRFSPVSTSCCEKINFCTSKPPEAPKMNSRFKTEFNQSKVKMLSNTSHFIKASDLMNNIENQEKLQNVDLSFGETGNVIVTNSRPKKKFVFKQKSTITQRKMH